MFCSLFFQEINDELKNYAVKEGDNDDRYKEVIGVSLLLLKRDVCYVMNVTHGSRSNQTLFLIKNLKFPYQISSKLFTVWPSCQISLSNSVC